MARASQQRRDAHRGASIEDVAAAAGVSVATVSRALRNLPNVAPRTAARVWDVARQLHYQPNPQAAGLARGRSNIVGVAVPTIAQWYFGALVSAIEAVLRPAGYGVMLFAVADTVALDTFVGRSSPLSKRVDGLIMADLIMNENQLLDAAALPTAVVTLGQRSDRFSSVDLDDEAAIRTLTRHLLALGHRRFGLIRGESDAMPLPRTPIDRRHGVVAALAEAGIRLDPACEVDGRFTPDGGADAMRRLLALEDRPTAVIALSDEMAAGAMIASRDAGVAVPADLSVAGFDDHPLAGVLGLTTMRQDVEEFGRIAAELVVRQLDDHDAAPIHRVMSATLVERRSTAPPPPAP